METWYFLGLGFDLGLVLCLVSVFDDIGHGPVLVYISMLLVLVNAIKTTELPMLSGVTISC